MARVAAVQLDFLQPSAVSRLSLWLLVAGVLAALVVLLEYRQVSAQAQARAAELDELRSMSRRSRPAIEPGEADSPEIREQIKKANGVLEQLNVPWGELFAAIETAQSEDVALLKVQPDARSRTVQLGGAARSLSAVLDYMTRLERTEDLGDVLLVSHEMKLREPGRPVEFVLSARWMKTR
jgi:Tfp pilus assembly protein PilN